ncbi:MAG: HsdR family type I site-specific deoxyribonuclease [Treponema sp.]|nr:HsdR family type I site-specific deoxyribonuclease [Treponema sp.]
MTDINFVKGKFTEQQLENAIIELLQEEGYSHVCADTLHRRYDEVLLEDDLKAYLLSTYSKENLTENEITKIINNIKLVSPYPNYDGNRETFYLVNEGFDLARDDPAKQGIHINLIDFERPENNIFKVINQFVIEDRQQRRPDVLLFVNGIPVVICEFKTAIEEDKTIFDAWKQIHNRYNRDIPKLMKYCFLSVISDGANSKMGTIFTPYEYYYSWRKVNYGETSSDGIESLMTLIKGTLNPKRLLAILRDFLVYHDSGGNERADVCRYPQYFAALMMLQNIETHLRPNGDGKGGTYFGATGCGKTHIMLYLTRLLALRKREIFNNPTVIIITDREDLDDQTSELFVASKRFLHEENVKSIENRIDLQQELGSRESGGIFITTIQKFCEKTGLLSARNNIICISDEAHRTQTNDGSKLKITDEGVKKTYGFAKYLRDSFPNATYLGFTGTPIDETLHVFGGVVAQYTMQESCDDDITVPITYEPRLARVLLSDNQAKEIQKYYNQCLEEGTNSEQVEKSKRAMSELKKILGHPERRKKLALDIVTHYEALCSTKPNIVQKAMIVCDDRTLAYVLFKEIIALRPEWNVPKKSENDEALSKEEADKLMSLEKIKMVATRDKDDEKTQYNLLGDREYRKKLDKQFKKNNSNFKIAIVVDMWITGFDIPSLAVMYIDKPIQRHTLIQTISRVNRKFEGKDRGLIVDYIGIKEDMMVAVKKYSGPQGSPVDELKVALDVFKNHLKLVSNIMYGFNANKFYNGSPLERLVCLNNAAEFVQLKKDIETRFMNLTLKLKASYEICFPSGSLEDNEIEQAQFYLAIRSIIYKQTKGNTPDAEIMNRHVEEMVMQAISCSGIENIVNHKTGDDIFGDDFKKQLSKINMPITKFNALLQLLKRAISAYGKTNKVKAIVFDERLKKVVEQYNSRDKLTFTSAVVADFVNGLSDEIIKIIDDLKEDKNSFEKLGITYEEKIFYDILVKVRDDHQFEYAEEKCIVLAREIKKLVDDKSKYTDWATRDDIKSELNMDLTKLLYKNGYPPEWDDEVFQQVLEQSENYKKYSGAFVFEYPMTKKGYSYSMAAEVPKE